MPTKRQTRFLHAVAEAASAAKPPKRSGRPTPANLTSEGRSKGLSAMRKAKRCRGSNSSGNPCQAPAMRGSTRCLKHGGRVEVPAHPHNIKRFFEGNAVAEKTSSLSEMSDQEHWDQLPYRLKREILDLLPPDVVVSSFKLFRAARVWTEVRDGNFRAVQAFLDEFVRKKRA